ncbi:MAG: CRISPR-associated CARF protein Csx1 [Candidatus Nitrosocaldus sp.]|nr:CRISPR-associated CARF protein Csx1 [Candidatus Nitrosocaldus sp.]MDW8275778.1 CRISPR-associated CARF protein Csx1 [Candidatus Nitrosocaldus sp.]
MDILIAPWGDPSNWKIVSYRYKEGCSASFSSSLALSRLLNISADDTITIVTTTLIDEPVRDYVGLERTIKEKVASIVKAKNEKVRSIADRYKPVDTEPRIWVVPGIGTFRLNSEVFIHEGITDLYYNTVYHATLRFLEERITRSTDGANDSIRIHIDITHGVNYMPLLTVEAIMRAASTLASTKGIRVDLTVYNSDPLYPFPKDDDPSIILNINEISNSRHDGYSSLPDLLMEFVSSYNLNYYRWRRIGGNDDIKDDEIKIIHKAAKAAAFGLLLVVGSLRERLNTYYSIVDKKLAELPTINVNSGNVRIQYKDRVRREAAVLHSVLKALTSIDAMKEMPLSKIEELNDRYYKRVEPVNAIVGEELSKIKKNIAGSDYRLLGEVMDSDFDSSKKCRCNMRIMYAHGGFEKNVTYIKKEGREMYLTYGECLDEILNQI